MKRPILVVLAILLLAAPACGGPVATVTLPTETRTTVPIPPPGPQVRGPILIGTEYIVIEREARVATLADMLAPLGLPAAKPLPENFSWGNMQPSREAEIDFRQLDSFVAQFQAAGFVELVLALKPHSSWASNDYPSQGLLPLRGGVRTEYLGDYENWVYSVVERYDADGSEDMPGLRYPVRFYEIGTEFSSYEPEPVEEYLVILERAYTAAHRAYPEVLIAHAAFLTTLAFTGDPSPAEYERAFETMADRTHSLADMRKVLDRPDLFDVLNLHSLGDPYEIEAMVAWLDYEMAQRGYRKPIILSDTATTPFISWGPATACDRNPNQMGKVIPPATEADRCRLADYFTRLVKVDQATLRWTQGFAAQDMVKKVVIAAEQGILLINTAFTEDIFWLKLPPAQAAAGTSAWAGLVDVERREYRPAYYALRQLVGYLDGHESITRLALDEEGVRVYEISRAGQRFWIAWYDPERLILPGDPPPEKSIRLRSGGDSAVVEPLITQFGQDSPTRVTLSTQDGLLTLILTPTPVFIFAGE